MTQLAADDDGDFLTSGGLGYAANRTLIDYSNGIQSANIAMPPAVHPLPLNGAGISYLTSTAGGPGARRVLSNPVANNPTTWPSYTSGHWHNQNSPTPTPAGNTVCKLDLRARTHTQWREPGGLPGEPVFIPRPGGSAEDDGVLLSLVTGAGGGSFVVVLDARSLAELARARLAEGVPYGFHGCWLPAVGG